MCAGLVAALVQGGAGRIGNDRSLNYRSFPRITIAATPDGMYTLPAGSITVIRGKLR